MLANVLTKVVKKYAFDGARTRDFPHWRSSALPTTLPGLLLEGSGKVNNINIRSISVEGELSKISIL